MRNSIMAQLVQQLAHLDRLKLVRRDRAFKVKFAGEAADDYGGPYREVFTRLCSELENEAVLPLLMPTPNGQQGLGSNRDRFVVQLTLALSLALPLTLPLTLTSAEDLGQRGEELGDGLPQRLVVVGLVVHAELLRLHPRRLAGVRLLQQLLDHLRERLGARRDRGRPDELGHICERLRRGGHGVLIVI